MFTKDKEVARVIGLALTLGALLWRSPVALAIENPPIRVRLESSLEQIEFEGVGIQIQGQEKFFQFVAIPNRQKIKISLQKVNGKPIWQIARNGQIQLVHEPFLGLKSFDEIRSDGQLLPGQVFLAATKGLNFDVIGILPLEDYVVGVIASEMPLSWPMETLKAQAIAARSYALGAMRERAKQIYHVESNILDQVFSHIGRGPDESPLVAKAKEAVQSTAGITLVTGEKTPKVLKAFYHSDCGGRTSDAKTVWGVGPSTGAAVDPSCPNNPRAHWSLRLSELDLSQRLRDFLKKPSLKGLQSLSLRRPSVADRIDQIELVWETGGKMQISSQNFRAALGFDQLKSTMFEMKKSDQGYQFKGIGFGHGVGLCQWGARHLGQQGRRFEEILSHYYPKARMQLPGEVLQARTELGRGSQTE